MDFCVRYTIILISLNLCHVVSPIDLYASGGVVIYNPETYLVFLIWYTKNWTLHGTVHVHSFIHQYMHQHLNISIF